MIEKFNMLGRRESLPFPFAPKQVIATRPNTFKTVTEMLRSFFVHNECFHKFDSNLELQNQRGTPEVINSGYNHSAPTKSEDSGSPTATKLKVPAVSELLLYLKD
jgi:hypothetical protein